MAAEPQAFLIGGECPGRIAGGELQTAKPLQANRNIALPIGIARDLAPAARGAEALLAGRERALTVARVALDAANLTEADQEPALPFASLELSLSDQRAADGKAFPKGLERFRLLGGLKPEIADPVEARRDAVLRIPIALFGFGELATQSKLSS